MLLHHRAVLLTSLTLCVALTGCDVYDPGALRTASILNMCGDGRWGEGELCDTMIAAGEPGACPERCPPSQGCEVRVLAGEGCKRECVTTLITRAEHGDGCCPQGMGAADDADCGMCGDGIVGPTESCDPPDSCLTLPECGEWGACLTVRLTGSSATCNARCELNPIKSCANGDGCCPTECNRTNDSDCSQTCGNGILEPGEACERGSSTPCPSACPAGGSCMTAITSGKPENCNVECAYVAITQPIAGDGCCPPGAHSLNDSDCMPRCGNAVVEAGEACDGGPYCRPDCNMMNERERCVVVEGNTNAACTTCSCDNCAALTLGCFSSGNAERDSHCNEVITCSRDTGCVGDACYCGTSPNCAYPNGPCRLAIEAAARAGGVTVAACENDPNCATYWASRYGTCRRTNCAQQCNL